MVLRTAVPSGSIRMTDTFPLAARGVYAQPFTKGGRREFIAVDSRGEQVASRLIRSSVDPDSAIAELWEELEQADPIPSHLTPPSLRLVR